MVSKAQKFLETLQKQKISTMQTFLLHLKCEIYSFESLKASVLVLNAPGAQRGTPIAVVVTIL